MFERYTEKARQAVFFARFEAALRECEQIFAGNLLTGILIADPETSLALLGQDNIAQFGSWHSAEQIHQMLLEAHKTDSTPQIRSVTRDMQLSAECMRILLLAEQEAASLGHDSIDHTHLLLGLLRSQVIEAEELKRRGVDLTTLRTKIAGMADSPPSPST